MKSESTIRKEILVLSNRMDALPDDSEEYQRLGAACETLYWVLDSHGVWRPSTWEKGEVTG